MKGKINQYWSASEPVLVTYTYQYWSKLRPVLLRAVTSTTSFFVCIELRSSSLYETTLMALEYGNKSS